MNKVLKEDDLVLRQRYRLGRCLIPLHGPTGHPYELWTGSGAGMEDGGAYLIKLWPVEPSERRLERALWDRELRHLFRIASLPGAPNRLVVLKDAGVDSDIQRFLMVLESSAPASATTPLSIHLAHRTHVHWLSHLKNVDYRLDLWKALGRLAQGLDMLHRQQIIHREVSEETVFADSNCTAESWRLGGFEWSVRINSADIQSVDDRTDGNTGAPAIGEPHSFASDWRGFGMLAARVLVGDPAVAAIRSGRGSEALRAVLESSSGLWDAERTLIRRLVDARRSTRLTRSEDILAEIRRIEEDLSDRSRRRPDGYLALFVDLAQNRALTAAVCKASKDACEAALVIGGPASGGESPAAELSLLDTIGQRHWIEQDLIGAQLLRAKQRDGSMRYTLIGHRLQYSIFEERAPEAPPGTWASARCAETGYQVFGDENQDKVGMPIRVFRSAESAASRAEILAQALSWRPFLPTLLDDVALSDEQQHFLDFLSFTNQIDILFRDAEIFPYRRVADHRDLANQVDYWVLEDRERDREPLRLAYRNHSESLERASDLGRYVDEQRLRGTRNLAVYLGESPTVSLNLHPDEVHRATWQVVEPDEYPAEVMQKLRELDGPVPAPTTTAALSTTPRSQVCLVVKRGFANVPGSSRSEFSSPTEGFLRDEDHRGQTVLIHRRAVAIERMREHTYLLDALLRPVARYIDTTLAPPDLPGSFRLDEAKQTALRYAWRTRPIFVLQGPPGTGKTTYVANLLGRIFAEDPTAQVLVTAQAHPAVDVLRESVTRIFEELHKPGRPLADVEPPLTIRAARPAYGVGQRERYDDPDYAHPKAAQLLDASIKALDARSGTLSAIQKDWLAIARRLRPIIKSGRSEAGAGEFVQLVRRAANLTYCTSTSGELVKIDQRNQTFDWSIIEEAGKAHGFDVALPLRLGHRWVLIGDQFQLKPFRYVDFVDATANVATMNKVVHALDELRGGGGLVDRDLLARWNGYSARQSKRKEEAVPPEQLELWQVCKTWLSFFSNLYRVAGSTLEHLPDEQRRQAAPLAMMLNRQHRMHPKIAELVSRAFYETKPKTSPLLSETRDAQTGALMARVRHAFERPDGIAGKAIVWIDVPRLHAEAAPGGDRLLGKQRAPSEVEAILRLLHTFKIDDSKWDACFDPTEPPTTGKKNFKLAVLSPYNKQVAALRSALRDTFSSPLRPAWLRRQETDRQTGSHAYVHTVDSYQGNEADVVIVSLVRNADLQPLRQRFGADAPKVAEAALGFLQEDERMNVLASRAERLLVLVGCWEFFYDVTRQIPGTVGQPLCEWRVLVDFLEDEFKRPAATAEALRLPVEALDRLPDPGVQP